MSPIVTCQPRRRRNTWRSAINEKSVAVMREKSFAPDGTLCKGDTRGLLKRTHIVAGELRYVGKETDHKWEEGDDISVLEFKATEYGRSTRVVASEEVKNDISKIGINKCARESGFDRKNFIRKLVRGLPVKRNSYAEFERWLRATSHKWVSSDKP